MTDEEITKFLQRIDAINPDKKPLFGIMSANQMICHCTDLIRIGIGTKVAEEYGKVDPKEIISLSKSGKPVPAPKGLGQIEGGGTQPTTFINDVNILKQHILDFSSLQNDFDFKPHPYFGKLNKERWTRLVIHHLNHHLDQFDV